MGTSRPVDIASSGADTLGIFNIEVGFNTRVALVILAAVDSETCRC